MKLSTVKRLTIFIALQTLVNHGQRISLSRAQFTSSFSIYFFCSVGSFLILHPQLDPATGALPPTCSQIMKTIFDCVMCSDVWSSPFLIQLYQPLDPTWKMHICCQETIVKQSNIDRPDTESLLLLDMYYYFYYCSATCISTVANFDHQMLPPHSSQIS